MAKSDQDPQPATILHGEIFTQPRFTNVNHMHVQIREKVQHLQLNWDLHWFRLAVTQCSNLVLRWLRTHGKALSLGSRRRSKDRAWQIIQNVGRTSAFMLLPAPSQRATRGNFGRFVDSRPLRRWYLECS